MKEINELVELSKYAGERFDLVQAAGGNTSVKMDNGHMLIKASGFTLSEVTKKSGFSTVMTKQVADIIKDDNIINLDGKRERENATSLLVKAATIDKTNRPSIETLLHSLLLKYTLHTHPVVANIILARIDFREVLNTIFNAEPIVIVDYATPGIELAIQMDNELKKFDSIPNIIFLKNHGIIITSDEKDKVKEVNEYVLGKIEKYLQIDMSRYKLTNRVTALFNSIEEKDIVSYLSEDVLLNNFVAQNRDLFHQIPFCPDTFVYCGIHSVEIIDFKSQQPLMDYKEKYFELPKVIIYKNHILLVAPNIKKAREIEEVLKFHIFILSQNEEQKINFLDSEELGYLANWEAEKFRQNL